MKIKSLLLATALLGSVLALDAAEKVVGGPKGAAARLGMRRSTLHGKMKRLGISRSE